ncbi:hypothetical protein LSAT2_023105 [Lamellibrachia satsuma]|nr:hypothetical protein LSAT2_023105 [Lamellibrachia satsuma]
MFLSPFVTSDNSDLSHSHASHQRQSDRSQPGTALVSYYILYNHLGARGGKGCGRTSHKSQQMMSYEHKTMW